VIDDVDGGRVRLTDGEELRGALVPLAGGTLAKAERGFEQMNEARKQRAEASEPADRGAVSRA
jgi:hypothetical protein